MKILYIVAGANGSGKTTFADAFARQSGLGFLNADKIAESIGKKDAAGRSLRAGRIFFEKLQKMLTEEDSFVIETTLSGRYLSRYIRQAKERGFYVVILYLFLETEEAHILRVRHRVLNGGHDVPREEIVRRYHRSRKLFWDHYRHEVDEWVLYYNSDEVFEEVADAHTVYDEEKFEEFMKGVAS